MSFNIKFQRNLSDIRCFDKDVQDVLSLDGILRNETSILDPVIRVECDIEDIRNCNYMTIDAFNRKYFINDIASIRDGIVEISAHVDVISTYAHLIRRNTCIVKKQEHNYNLYLNDSSLKIYQNPRIVTKTFPSGFNTFEFVLAVAGS